MMSELIKLVDNCYYYESVLSNIYRSEDRGYRVTIKNWDSVRESKRYNKMKNLVITWVKQNIDPMKLLRANYELRNGEFYFDRMGHTSKTINLYWEWLKDSNVSKSQDIDTVKNEIMTSIFYISRYCTRKKITPREYFSGYMTKLVPDILKHIKRKNISYYVLVCNEPFISMCKTNKQGFKMEDWMNKEKFVKEKNLIESNADIKKFVTDTITKLENDYEE